MTLQRAHYLPAGLPTPADDDGAAAPYWTGLREGRLRVQHCVACGNWQAGGEWICHRCLAFDPAWDDVPAHGLIYSWERVWHPVHPVLRGFGPYLVVLVELPHAGGARMLGNLLGDPMQDVKIGATVQGVFEPHAEDAARAVPAYSLLQWRPTET